MVVPTGALTVRTRLRLSDRDAVILRELAEYLSRLASRDLAERVRLGPRHTAADFARRKRGLTALTSSRWAGTITRGSNEQWQLARRAQAAHLRQLVAAIEAIERRLAAPVGGRDEVTRARGYPSRGVRAAKQRRLQILRARAGEVAADSAAGRVHVVRGGKDLLHSRLHPDRPAWTPEEWRHREHCDRFGRYTLDARCRFAYRADEWRAQVEAHRAVGYTIPVRRRPLPSDRVVHPGGSRPAGGRGRGVTDGVGTGRRGSGDRSERGPSGGLAPGQAREPGGAAGQDRR
ncbi:hypothetical protein ABZ615_03370 [Streptomyces sp. NPDC007325]|uniref:hypothetical protein n=1 Tax=Streptomyces sp. NPDC007325 TaxID=3154588 RepID=UPI0033C960D4